MQDSRYSQVYEKFRNERKHAQDPLVLQRKRKLVDNGDDMELVKKSAERRNKLGTTLSSGGR